MATKEQITEYIDAKWSEVWTADEEALVDQMLTPELADILIKLVGEVEFLTEVSGNKSN
jgi:hypothetical protein